MENENRTETDEELLARFHAHLDTLPGVGLIVVQVAPAAQLPEDD